MLCIHLTLRVINVGLKVLLNFFRIVASVASVITILGKLQKRHEVVPCQTA